MGQKDITEKLLEDYNDVFADIINGLIFKGEQRILPESLENAKVHSQYKAEDGKVHELERDVIKYWKEKKVELAICGAVLNLYWMVMRSRSSRRQTVLPIKEKAV